MHYPKQDKLDKPPFEGLDVSKKAFTFLQPLLHEWMSEWMNEKLITGRMEEVKKGKPNNHQFTLITYTNKCTFIWPQNIFSLQNIE